MARKRGSSPAITRRAFLKAASGVLACLSVPFAAHGKVSGVYQMQKGEKLIGIVFNEPTTIFVSENGIIRDCTWTAGGVGDWAAISIPNVPCVVENN